MMVCLPVRAKEEVTMESQFPLIVLMDGCELQGANRFLLIGTPDKLPIGETMVIFATCATPEMLDAIKRAWNTGHRDGVQEERTSQRVDER
jgi:hypothetical protein